MNQKQLISLFMALFIAVTGYSQIQPIQTFHHPAPFPGGSQADIYATALSPDGTKVLTASYGVKVWSTKTGELMLDLKDFDNFVQSAEFSPDGQYIVTGDWVQTVKIWNSNTGELIRSFRDPETPDPTGDFVYCIIRSKSATDSG